MHLLGIDGALGGWMGASITPGVAAPQPWMACGLAELHAWLADRPLETTWVVIDMPMGLPDAGPRACEALARQRLGPRRSSVFAVPIRPMLAARDYEAACAIGRSVDGRALSRQAWGITPRIRELDAWLREHTHWRSRVVEAHPELAFARLNGGTPLPQSKRDAAGAAQRTALIEAIWPGVVTRFREAVPRRFAADDDVRDALVLLTVAKRLADGSATRLPAAPALDATGLTMQIAY